jgi:signal transduction histidine kinase
MQPTMHRATARRLGLDLALILLLAGASLLWSNSKPLLGDPNNNLPDVMGSTDAWRFQPASWWLASLPAVVAIFLRHRWPVAATLMAAASTGLHLVDWKMSALPMDLAVLITMYALAGTARTRRTAITVLIALEALLYIEYVVTGMARAAAAPATGNRVAPATDRMAKVAHAAIRGDAWPVVLDAAKGATIFALLLAATWAVADSTRTRRAHLATLETRAADLEREQQQRTALAVATERGRITRELHDVVAHGLSVIVVQALGGRAVLAKEPDRTGVALTNIVTTGRASLAEMRRLLGLVRTEPAAELAPQPSLATLPELVDRVRDSGIPVDFRITGEPATLPTVVELSAYRIVQEALTNTLKHATPGAGCVVTLDFRSTGLGIRVADRGGPVPPPPLGNGLRGITERVHALGGELSAGPIAGGGFEVSARLPFGAFDPAASDPDAGRTVSASATPSAGRVS